MDIWSKFIRLSKSRLNLQNIVNILNFDEFINASNTLKQVGYWLKKLTITSVDITGLYNDEFNFKRYLVGWFNLLLMYLGIFLLTLSITNQWFFSLIDNQLIPKNFKIFVFYRILISIIATTFRFDILLAEWNETLIIFKVFYYIQEDIKSKHELTYENHRKFSILAKFLYVVSFKIIHPSIIAFAYLYYLYVAIISNRIIIQLLTPFAFYVFWLLISTVLLAASLGIGVFYYYILVFKQISNQFNLIYNQTLFFNIKDLKKLILLINKHNLVAGHMNKFNLIIRRTVLVFFVVVAILLIIPLNVYIKSNDKFEQIFCLGIIFVTLLYGFFIASSLSKLIREAHKPYKIIYQILGKKI